MRRLLDLGIATLALVIAAPVMLMIAAALTIERREPPIYASPRVGQGGRRFGFLRFRTMDGRTRQFTPVGALIRNISLDDLPNFLNVLLGDMSLVGPRPTEPERVNLSDPAWQRTLSVRPGLASLAINRMARTYNCRAGATRKCAVNRGATSDAA